MLCALFFNLLKKKTKKKKLNMTVFNPLKHWAVVTMLGGIHTT